MDDFTAITFLTGHMRVLARRLAAVRHEMRTSLRDNGDRGAMTTEAVIIIAGLAALAIVVLGIIVSKITAKANSIPTS